MIGVKYSGEFINEAFNCDSITTLEDQAWGSETLQIHQSLWGISHSLGDNQIQLSVLCASIASPKDQTKTLEHEPWLVVYFLFRLAVCFSQ